ncbi:unnamed protein product [Caenorhabditis auriculariae]|uniref:non-specific serine/threonine protein kinase n=1 Tax=Caenorhabditis auriculariae TaxID=2777116 RepID=A0A8S1GU16_9PELO|nr:unnamed protein product [Caenorhabditis auriculariae]
MHVTQENDLRSLVKKIKEKGTLKDEKIATCSEIAESLLKNASNNGFLPTSLLDELCWSILLKIGNTDLKKAVATVATAVGVLESSGSEYLKFLTWATEVYQKVPLRVEEERANVVRCVANVVTVDRGRSFHQMTQENAEKTFAWLMERYDTRSPAVFAELNLGIVVFGQSYAGIFCKSELKYFKTVLKWIADNSKSSSDIVTCAEAFKQLWEFSKEDNLVDLVDYGFATIDDVVTNSTRKLNGAIRMIEAFAEYSTLIVNVYPNRLLEIISRAQELFKRHWNDFSDAAVNYSHAEYFSSYFGLFGVVVQLKSVEVRTVTQAHWKESSLAASLALLLSSSAFLMSTDKAIRNVVGFLIKASSSISSQEGLEKLVQFVFDEKSPFFGPESDGSAYSLIRSDHVGMLTELLQTMLSPINLPNILEKLASNSYSNATSVRLAEIRFLICLTSVENIATKKNSLIVMMGIKPALFQFLLEEIPIAEQWLSDRHPAVYHVALQMLVMHLKAHEFYVTQSSWLVPATSPGISQSSKSEYFRQQIVALSKILKFKSDRIWKRTSALIMEWLETIIGIMDETSLQRVLNEKEFSELRVTIRQALLNEGNIEILLPLAQRLSVFSQGDFEYNVFLDKAFEKIKKSDAASAKKFWAAFDKKLILRKCLNTHSLISQEIVQKHITSSTFGVEEFVVITNFLVKGVLPLPFQFPENDFMSETLEVLVATCQSLEEGKTATEPPIDGNLMEKWRWTLAQTVMFCVSNKMKTPLGKPMQTFSVFSGELVRLAKEALRGKKDKESEEKKEISIVKNTLNDRTFSASDAEKERDKETKSRPLTVAEEWLRVRLLIEFVEILEKMIVNANNNGTMTPLCTPLTQQARQFFTTNANSCNEWLLRTYYSASVVSYYNGYYAQVIRFGSNSLAEYEKKALLPEKEENGQGKVPPMVLLTVMWMARAMAALGLEQATKGLSKWCSKVYGVEKVPVVDAMGHIASGRFEDALTLLEAVSKEDFSDSAKVLVRDTMVYALSCVRLPQAFDFFQHSIEDNESDEIKYVHMLTNFSKPSNPPQKNKLNWNLSNHLMAQEATLTQMIKRSEVVEMKEELSSLARCAVLADASGRVHSGIATNFMVASAVLDKINRKNTNLTDEQIAFKLVNGLSTSFLLENGDQTEMTERLTIGRQLINWAAHLNSHRVPNEMHLDLFRLARKSENRKLAYFHLTSLNMDLQNGLMHLHMARQAFKLIESDPTNTDETIVPEFNSLFLAMATSFQSDFHFKQTIGLRNEFNVDRLSEAMQNFNIQPGTAEMMVKMNEAMARTGVQIADYLVANPAACSYFAPKCASTILWHEMQRLSMGTSDFVGSLLVLATRMCPRLSKAHMKLAQWAYDFASNGSVRDKFFAHCNVPFGDANSKEALWKALNSRTLAQLETEVSKAIGAKLAPLLLTPEGFYVSLWTEVKHHRIRFYEIAAEAYFSYINMSAGSKKNEGLVSATLKILDLLIRNGDLVIDTVEKGLIITNVLAWKDILPQLFARLSHPSPEIRRILVDLLSRICVAAPHSVVFQIVAGASTYSLLDTEDVMSASDARDDEKVLSSTDERSQMSECCQKLEQHLEQYFPKLVRDVRQFVNELQRVNMLNEEKWAMVLSTMEYEMEKRLAQIRAENSKTVAASHLEMEIRTEIIEKKTKLITSQIFEVLDELYERTCVRPAETENEHEFQELFGEQLKAAFQESRDHRTNPEKAWNPFKKIAANLTQRNAKRGGQTYNMASISKILSNMSKSSVPMPGQDSVDFNDVISIDRVSAQAQVLPTKTRPKKLCFVGSDGKSHVFLFKGREDLHLDERVMQLLRLCNRMLSGGKAKSCWPEYTAHNYEVIPLGPRSGLIQWVEGATPLFHIYRRWQFRQKSLKQATTKPTETVTVGEFDRPSEIFQQKLRAAFANHKVASTVMTDRKEWPEDVLREVLQSLMQETPKDLISREFWMRSGCATTWWRVTNRFARSCAVMSMIGAILGLGDRHLDNLLVNLATGHLVHIDYNICFDKGRNLRVPETVPFRLTPNIVSALGPTQIEGVFRDSCEHVLKTLRAGKEVFMTMLDTFVYDPLVDWTASDHITSNPISLALTLAVYGSEWRANSVRSIAREMFGIRLVELSKPWMDNCEEIRTALQRVSDVLLKQSHMNRAVADRDRINQERVECGRQLKSAIARHHNMMKDFRPLIRVLAGCDSRFHDFIRMYKQYFGEPLLKGHAALDSTDADISSCLQHFEVVLEHIRKVFETLTLLDGEPEKQPALEPPPGLENAWVSKREQEENAHARNVVSEVEKRLDGKVEGSEVAVSPREQADLMIEHATSFGRLCKMYEGWTAWV